MPGSIAPVVPCPQPYGYRNRIMIRSQWDKFKQGLNIGFIRADNRLVVDIEECKIAEPALNEQIRRGARASAAQGRHQGRPARRRRRTGRCRAIHFSRIIFSCFPKLVETVRRVLAPGRRAFSGGRLLRRRFFRHRTGRSGGGVCRRGTGPTGDQGGPPERRRARDRSNGEFLAGPGGGTAAGACWRGFPRGDFSGVAGSARAPVVCRKAWRCCAGSAPAQIIYISCHPATMARDLNILCAEGVFELVQSSRWTCFRRPRTSNASRICG